MESGRLEMRCRRDGEARKSFPGNEEPARAVLGESKAEAGLGGTDDGVCKTRDLWWLMRVVLADPGLKNGFREGRGAP